MPNVSCNGNVYTCVTAIKGEDFIRLLDDSQCLVASFEGISDFSDYSITDGEWSAPLEEGECYLAVMRRDGSIQRSGVKCKDAAASATYECTLTAASAGWEVTSNTYTRKLAIKDLKEADLVMILSSSDYVWLQSLVDIQISPGYLVFSTTCLPAEDVSVTFSVMRLKPSEAAN